MRSAFACFRGALSAHEVLYDDLRLVQRLIFGDRLKIDLRLAIQDKLCILQRRIIDGSVKKFV